MSLKLTSCLTSLLILSTVPCAFGGRPLAIDDAEPVAWRTFEFEAAMRYNSDGRITHFDAPFALTYGLVTRVDVGAGFGSQIEEREELESRRKIETGLGDLTLGSKVKVLDATNFWLDQALAFTVKIPTADHCRGFGTGRFDYDLTWIGTYPLNETVNLHGNVGYTWAGKRRGDIYDDLLHYGFAADWNVRNNIQLVAEVYASTPVPEANATSALINGGLRWSLTQSVTIDAALGAGLRGETPDWMITTGLTWSFGPLWR